MYERIRKDGPHTQPYTATAVIPGFTLPCATYTGATQEVSYDGAYTYREIRDRPTHKYQSRKKRGEVLPVNPLFVEEVTATRSIGYYEITEDWGCKACPDLYSFTQIAPRIHLESVMSWDIVSTHAAPAVSRAKSFNGIVWTEAVASAKDGLFDILTFAAEYRETQEYIAGRLSQAARMISNFRKELRKLSKGKTRALPNSKELAGFELEYRYALLPIHLDIKSAIDTWLYSHLRRVRGSAQRADTVSGTKRVGVPRYLTGHSGATRGDPVEVLVTGISSISVKGYSIYEMGLHLPPIKTNILATLWEKIPLSFVLDWFLNVGDTLTAITPQPNFNFKVGGVTTEIVTSWETTGCVKNEAYMLRGKVWTDCDNVLWKGDVWGRYATPPEIAGVYKTITRVPMHLSDLSLVPKIEINLSPWRVADATALIRQALRS
jgi:hypothetical protein